MRHDTKRPMVMTTVRMPRPDQERWYAASKLLGISQSEFLRTALREHATHVLASTARQERGSSWAAR